MADRIYLADKLTLDSVKQDTTDLLSNCGAIKDIKGHKYKPVMRIDSIIEKSMPAASEYFICDGQYLYIYSINGGKISKYDLDFNLIAESAKRYRVKAIYVDADYIYVATYDTTIDGETYSYPLLKLDKNTLELVNFNPKINPYIAILLSDNNNIYAVTSDDSSSYSVELYKFDINTLEQIKYKTYSTGSQGIYNVNAQLDGDYIYIAYKGSDRLHKLSKDDFSLEARSQSFNGWSSGTNFIILGNYIFTQYTVTGVGSLSYIYKNNFLDTPKKLFGHIKKYYKLYTDGVYLYFGENRIKVLGVNTPNDFVLESFPISVTDLITVKKTFVISRDADNFIKNRLVYNIDHYEMKGGN